MKIFRSKEQKKFDKFKKAYFDKKDIEMLTDDDSCIKIYEFMRENNKLFEDIINFESEFDRLPIQVRLNAHSIRADITYFETKYCIVKFSKMNNKNYKKLNNLFENK